MSSFNHINHFKKLLMLFIFTAINFAFSQNEQKGLVIGASGYFEMPGLNVLVYNNTFAEGHQGGVEIIQVSF